MDRRTFVMTTFASGASLAALELIKSSAAASQLKSQAIASRNPRSQQPVVLITGTSSGIGKAAVTSFANQGYQVIATMRNLNKKNSEAAATLRTLAENQNLNISVIELDVRDDRSVQAGVEQAAQIAGGRLDVLVNNAGVYIPLPLELMPAEALYDSYNTNVLGAHRVSRAVLPLMREQQDGLILQISSGGGRVVFPLLGSYCSNKFALESLSDAMRYELAPLGIDVVSLQPDDTQTELLNNGRRYVETLMNTIASDRDRIAAYAEHLKLMDYALSNEDEPVPAEAVAAEIVKIATTEKGQRPGRVSLSGQLISDINSVMQNAQSEIISGTPYAAWQRLKV